MQIDVAGDAPVADALRLFVLPVRRHEDAVAAAGGHGGDQNRQLMLPAGGDEAGEVDFPAGEVEVARRFPVDEDASGGLEHGDFQQNSPISPAIGDGDGTPVPRRNQRRGISSREPFRIQSVNHRAVARLVLFFAHARPDARDLEESPSGMFRRHPAGRFRGQDRVELPQPVQRDDLPGRGGPAPGVVHAPVFLKRQAVRRRRVAPRILFRAVLRQEQKHRCADKKKFSDHENLHLMNEFYLYFMTKVVACQYCTDYIIS